MAVIAGTEFEIIEFFPKMGACETYITFCVVGNQTVYQCCRGDPFEDGPNRQALDQDLSP